MFCAAAAGAAATCPSSDLDSDPHSDADSDSDSDPLSDGDLDADSDPLPDRLLLLFMHATCPALATGADADFDLQMSLELDLEGELILRPSLTAWRRRRNISYLRASRRRF